MRKEENKSFTQPQTIWPGSYNLVCTMAYVRQYWQCFYSQKLWLSLDEVTSQLAFHKLAFIHIKILIRQRKQQIKNLKCGGKSNHKLLILLFQFLIKIPQLAVNILITFLQRDHTMYKFVRIYYSNVDQRCTL